MAELTGVGYTLAIDLSSATSYTDVDVTSASESFNETLDTYFKLSDGGFPTNVVTSLDPQIDFVFKFDSTDALLQDLIELRWKLGSDRECTFEITDNASGNTITGAGVFTSIGTTREVATVVEVPVTMKLKGQPTIAATT